MVSVMEVVVSWEDGRMSVVSVVFVVVVVVVFVVVVVIVVVVVVVVVVPPYPYFLGGLIFWARNYLVSSMETSRGWN